MVKWGLADKSENQKRDDPYFKAIFASVTASGDMTLDDLTVRRLDIRKNR